MYRLNISNKQFYVTLNEIWLFESDPNAPSTWSEPGGKQWQRSIRGRHNWDVELGPCAVIRHLCSCSCLCVRNEATTGGQFTKLDRPTGLLFKVRVMFLYISSGFFYCIPNYSCFFMIISMIYLLISLGILLAHENIEGTVWFFSNSVCRCS